MNSNSASIEPRNARWLQNPYPMYREIQQRRVIQASDAWYLGQYNDVLQFLKSGATVKSRPDLEGSPLMRSMLFKDGTDHRRLRGIAQPFFSTKGIQAMEEMIHDHCNREWKRFGQPGQVDLLRTFANDFPVAVMSEILGVDDADRARLSRLALAFVESHESVDESANTGQMLHAFEALRQAFDGLLEVRVSPNGLWARVQQGLADGELTREEAVETGCLMMVAGIETTTNALASGIKLLIEHPEQVEILKAHPEKIPGAVEEILRFESPVKVSTHRYLTEPMVVGDVEIPAGACVLGMIGAANRDPEVFDQPDVFNVDRAKNPHLAFGVGIHTCLGAHLARLELNAAFTAILPHLSAMKLSPRRTWLPWRKPSAILWRPHREIRGLSSLPISISRNR